MVEDSLATSTKSGYKGSEKEWFSFLSGRFPGMDTFLRGTDDIKKRKIMILFIGKLRDDGQNVNQRMSGLRFLFNVNMQPLGIFADEAIRAARKSWALSGREFSVMREQRRRDPVPFEFLRWLREKKWVPEVMDDRMAYIGCIMLYANLLRASEVTPMPGGVQHAILTDDVDFVLESGEIVNSSAFRRMLRPASDVKAIRCKFRSSKVNRSGDGKIEYYTRRSEVENECVK